MSLCRQARTLSVDSSLAEAIEAMRLESSSEICVVSGDRLEFIANASEIGRFLASSEAPVSAGDLSLRSFYAQSMFAINPDFTISAPFPRTVAPDAALRDVEQCFHDAPEAQIVAVCDGYGRYFGAISRVDLSAALIKSLFPLKVGGMATPLGVYLTDGIRGAGAGFWGLVLTGACMSVLIMICYVILDRIDFFVYDHWRFDSYGALVKAFGSSFAADFLSLAPTLLVFAAMRFTPLAGYHAAEHQVVNCIEQGRTLTIENVRKMSRVHPRCGTNYAAWFLIFSFALLFFSRSFSSIVAAVAPSILLAVLFWRKLGGFLQQYCTTRPASDKQIRSGIEAAQKLRIHYQNNIAAKNTPFSRLYSSGLPQVMLGAIFALGFATLLELIFPALTKYIPL